jgi:hypothetical protein
LNFNLQDVKATSVPDRKKGRMRTVIVEIGRIWTEPWRKQAQPRQCDANEPEIARQTDTIAIGSFNILLLLEDQAVKCEAS